MESAIKAYNDWDNTSQEDMLWDAFYEPMRRNTYAFENIYALRIYPAYTDAFENIYASLTQDPIMAENRIEEEMNVRLL